MLIMTMDKAAIEYPMISSIGDQAFLITFGDRYTEQTNARVLEFDRKLALEEIPWVIEVVPAIRSVLVRIDPLLIAMDEVELYLQNLANLPLAKKLTKQARKFEIPVAYGGKYGPDLAQVAAQTGLTVEKLIELHCFTNLRVACLGFSPGLAYLATLPEEFDLPRKESYNSTAQPGSILVANRQTVFTATEIPTGWSIIGRSPVIGFRLEPPPYFLLQPGDEIRFYPIPLEEFEESNFNQIWDAHGLT